MRNNGLRPLYQRIKILPDPIDDKTVGGIVLPTAVKDARAEKQIVGTVIEIGGAVEFLKPGDRILIGEYAGFGRYEDNKGNELDRTNKEAIYYKYCNESDAIAIFIKEKGESSDG